MMGKALGTVFITDYETGFKICRESNCLSDTVRITGKWIRIILTKRFMRYRSTVLEGRKAFLAKSECIKDEEPGSSVLAFTWKDFDNNAGLQDLENGKYRAFLVIMQGKRFCPIDVIVCR